jgi:hypothetical protein
MLGMLALLALSPATAAAEEETHLFSATLSLTGDCSTATIDPVPDPGCPGGAHPPKPFTKHGAVAIDLYGNRYVASAGANADGSEGRIDVFDSSGEFITEVPATIPQPGPGEIRVNVAVDSQGYLYLSRNQRNVESPHEALLRYKPTKYNPAAGEIAYGTVPVVIPNPFHSEGTWSGSAPSLAVDPADDHLFAIAVGRVVELSSAAEGNGPVDGTLGEGVLHADWSKAVALDSVRKRVYVSDLNHLEVGNKPVVKVFDLEAPHDVLFTIDGSTTPTERFVSETWALPVAADEATGHLFVGDLEAPTRRVYEFDEEGVLVATLEGKFKATGTNLLEIAYDDSPTSATQGYLFVPSHNGPGRSLAFEPKPAVPEPPLVEELSVSGLTDSEAILAGKVNPQGLEATYRIEYTTQAQFEAQGFEGATLAGEGTVKASSEGIAVSALAAGLSPASAYRFRIVAQSEAGEAEADAPFATYATPQIDTNCPNQPLRTGLSALLPDCRAYELVTPADTNGHPPFGQSRSAQLFPSRLSSPAGERLSFKINGGGLPAIGNTGSFFGDPYLARRGQGGWQSEFTGPSAAFAPSIIPGSSSPDQTHSVWQANGPEPAYLGAPTTYVHYPDGHDEPLGQGTLTTDPGAEIKLIAEDALHVIFATGGSPTTPRQLEENAPPDGTRAIYDRSADGVLHVVSLLPGELTPAAGQDAFFQGASLDGEGVAFEIEGTLYLRYRNEASYAIGAGLDFAGVAEGGSRIFYVKEGDLYAFDATTEATIPFSASGDAVPVNVAAAGTAAYFLSPSVLTEEPNPSGAEPQAGKQNLYLSEEGQLSFVGVLTDRDVEGELISGIGTVDGLGLWLQAQTSGPAIDPSRTTPDGEVLLFESRAQLTAYDTKGHTQVYRYDASAGTLACLSCNPTGAPATGRGALQEIVTGPIDNGVPLHTSWNPVDNLRADGERAFFESTEALVLSDTDGLRDVYEWEEEGVGGCETPGGCLYLITSGQSGREDFLYAVSDSGDDVFFWTADLLAPAFDPDETPSIYDARVGGGFAPPTPLAGECLGEACQPQAVAPNDPTPASSSFEGQGNVKEATRPRCPKGKRALRRAGRTRCVPRHRHHKRAKAKRRAGR